MTVKEAISVLKDAKTIVLGYGSDSIPFNMHNPISLDAFGDYIVDKINGSEDEYYEINIAMRPIKEGD